MKDETFFHYFKHGGNKMKIFNKCTHEYILYNVASYVPLFSTLAYARYDFVCKKCRKEKFIYSQDLEDEINEIKSELNKKRIIENSITKLNQNESFVMKPYGYTPICYCGEHIVILKQRYSKCGINLNEITSYYKTL